MFKRLFGKKVPEYRVDCAMCNLGLTLEIDSNLQPSVYEHDPSSKKFAEINCPFCKTSLAVICNYKGEFIARDIKWDIEVDKYEEQESDLGDQENELDDIIDNYDGNYNDQEVDEAKKRLGQIETKLEKVHESFDSKDYRYRDRQANWQDKMKDKYG